MKLTGLQKRCHLYFTRHAMPWNESDCIGLAEFVEEEVAAALSADRREREGQSELFAAGKVALSAPEPDFNAGVYCGDCRHRWVFHHGGSCHGGSKTAPCACTISANHLPDAECGYCGNPVRVYACAEGLLAGRGHRGA